MMLRCTNPECRSCMEFNIPALGDRWALPENMVGEIHSPRNLVKTKAGKRTKDLEEIRSYVAKCMGCGHRDLVKNMQDAYENPLKVFNTDNLCDCGGEIWNDVEVKKKETPAAAYDPGDSQRAVAMTVRVTVRCEKCGKVYKDSVTNNK